MHPRQAWRRPPLRLQPRGFVAHRRSTGPGREGPTGWQGQGRAQPRVRQEHTTLEQGQGRGQNLGGLVPGGVCRGET